MMPRLAALNPGVLRAPFAVKRPSFQRFLLLGAIFLFSLAHPLRAAEPVVPKIKPTIADLPYGTDPKQVFDLYRPTHGQGPYPIFFWVHGGGWNAGNKTELPNEPNGYLDKGCAIVSINYRLGADAVAEKISPPIVAELGDARRALQYVRLHAADWNLDPEKIVVGGVSAGACTALYLGCEGEQADPKSADPIERVSTRVLGVGAVNGQASVDPQRINAWNPGVAWGQWAFVDSKDYGFDQFLADRDKWLTYINKYSPEILMTKDSPPIYFLYLQRLADPNSKPTRDQLVHSPLWGIGFEKLARAAGVECYLCYPDHPSDRYATMHVFLLHQLGINR